MLIKTTVAFALAILRIAGIYFAVRPARANVSLTKETPENGGASIASIPTPASAAESIHSEAGSRAAEPMLPPARRLARVAGRFLDGEGRPVAGVRVLWAVPKRYLQFTPIAQPTMETANPSTPDIRSADDGSFVFSELFTSKNEIDNGARREFITHKTGFARRSFSAELKAGELIKLGDLVLQPGGDISGSVVDSAGRAAADAAVATVFDNYKNMDWSAAALYGPPGSNADVVATDAEGRFAIDGAAPGKLRIVAWKSDTCYAVSGEIVLNAGDARGDVRLILDPLPPEATIEGEVRAPDGSGCLAEVLARFNNGTTSGLYSSREGVFRHRLQKPGPVTYDARDLESRLGFAHTENVRGGERGVILQLTAPRKFELELVDQFGDKLEQAFVNASCENLRYSMSNRGLVPLEPRGMCMLDVPPIRFSIDVKSPGYAPAKAGPFDPATLPARERIILKRLARIRGRVVADEKSVANVNITICGGPAEGRHDSRARVYVFSPSHWYSGVTDANGRFEIAPAEEFTNFYVQTRSAASADMRQFGPFHYDSEKGSDDLTIRISAGGAVEGHLLLPAGRDPKNILIGASTGNADEHYCKADASGYYHFERIAPGPCEIRVVSIDGAPFDTRMGKFKPESRFPAVCEVREGETTKYDIDLRTGLEPFVDGYIHIGGRSFTGASVELSESTESPSASKALRAVVDGDGRFRVAPEAMNNKRDYTIRLTLTLTEGSTISVNDWIKLYPMGATPWFIDVDAGRVEGKLAEGVDPSTASLYYRSLVGAPDIQGTVAVAADGTFVIDPAPVGQLWIYRSRSRDHAMCTVEAGATSRVKLP
ncbi:MAG: hypothetical protein HY286_02415 [Planctomycetes bacterium]|nr:hypothetical protein [Planctomycetota bacterium]